MSTKKLTAIGINIYGGGFTLGVSKHFKVLGQWEEIKLGAKTFDMNFKGLYRPLNRSEWPVQDHQDKVNFVFANPPCAPWSSANTHLGKTKASRFLDPRLALTAHTYDAALALRPDVFISESVEAGYNVGASHYDKYIDMWIKAGYAVTFFMTDAVLHGAPCARRRFHFIAHRYKLQLGQVPKIEKARTVGDAIKDLVIVKNQVPLHTLRPVSTELQELMSLTKPGERLSKAYDRVKGGYKGYRVSFLAKRFKWDKPSFTMVNFNFVHPIEHRWITFREAMRLCTYPDTFMAHNAIEAVDAVLPAVAEFLAVAAKKTIVKAEPTTPEFNFVDWRPHGKQFHINSKQRVL